MRDLPAASYRSRAWVLALLIPGCVLAAGNEPPSGQNTNCAAATPARAQAFSVVDYGAVPSDGEDDFPAFDAARRAASAEGHGLIRIPAGVWDLSRTVASEASNVNFAGDGPGATVVRAMAPFEGSALFVLGRKQGAPCVQTANVTTVQLKSLTLDGNAQAVTGFEAYGLRDGSAFEDVVVRNQHTVPGVATNQSCNLGGAADVYQNQGVQFRNVWVIGGPWVRSAAWLLDGLFESQVIGGGARGMSSTSSSHAAGFAIGTRAGVQGLTLLGASVTMIKDSGNGSARTNAGIRYGEWVRNSRDIGTTFEGITGAAVSFEGGRASGSSLPFNVQSLQPRLYMNARGQPDGFGRNTDYFMNPAIQFGVASDCRAGPIVAYAPWKTWVRFDGRASAGQQRNSAEVSLGPMDPSHVAVSSVVSFDEAAASTNWVDGVGFAGREHWTVTLGPATVVMQQGTLRKQLQQHAPGRSGPARDEGVLRVVDADGAALLEVGGDRPAVSPKAPPAFDSAWNGSVPLLLGQYRFWVDASGRLRVKRGRPSGDTDGTVIGDQYGTETIRP
ncbi:hypothetical protein Adeh_4285 [Anaeromyxobacter dehalogenans 2CP-C]|uniref:Rhamnogalacturonase A/B/Epimerase-like pectate lyase domain-containing protein n=2 Tax=Anaeromyxobacter dehalogenans TaxID=161493 RepID=Q2IHJ2_ANADE|nr:hypothetical protein Adeh_4285 [Anaeromyxobacter dehalogenans 2CP-C]